MHGWTMDWSLLLPGIALAAIPVLGWLAQRLSLGVDVRLRDPAAAQDLARLADCTFEPARIGLDRAGLGALLADRSGQVILVRRHGARFVAHPLTGPDGIQLERNFLRFALPEPGFTPITLDLGADAQHWVAALRRAEGISANGAQRW